MFTARARSWEPEGDHAAHCGEHKKGTLLIENIPPAPGLEASRGSSSSSSTKGSVTAMGLLIEAPA